MFNCLSASIKPNAELPGSNDYFEESNRKLQHLFNPSGKTAAFDHVFAVEDLPSTELQPWFLRLQWKICPWVEHSDDDDDDDDDDGDGE